MRPGAHCRRQGTRPCLSSWTLDSGIWILGSDPGLWTLDSGFWILILGFWTLDSGFWILILGFCIGSFSSRQRRFNAA